MAGVVVHLAVADTVAERLDLKDIPLFYAGNIAPDCVHARENYKREMKKHTHLREGICDWDFLSKENITAFHGRLNEFAEKYCNKKNNVELYLGYLSHLISDEVFMKTVREECAEKAREYGILQTDRQFFDFMMRELNGSDAITVKEYQFHRNPIETVRKAYGCSVKDYISADEIVNSNEWIAENFFSGKNEYEKPFVMTKEKIFSFIGSAADEFCKRTESIVKNIL